MSYAFILALAGVLAGYKTTLIAFKKDFNRSIGIALGGMAIRLLLTVIIIGVMFAVLDIDPLYFGITYCISYFVFLMGEIVYVNTLYNNIKRTHHKTLQDSQAV